MTGPQAHRQTMTPERWQQIQDVLAAAIECDGSRDRLLDERCAGDPALRREVESLLAAHHHPGPLDRLADAVAPATLLARGRASGGKDAASANTSSRACSARVGWGSSTRPATNGWSVTSR